MNHSLRSHGDVEMLTTMSITPSPHRRDTAQWRIMETLNSYKQTELLPVSPYGSIVSSAPY
ncbi:hypothetical protein UPYG_G00004240 [Umbra pygmaea]|uniref:Uncharacterized protein n=1 Tax=Umbra pygmaea TaxID=75934 RepID=A0ABD0XH21_UMBPY